MSDLSLKRIVYVDDEPHIRMLAQACLTRVGCFETAVYASGRECLEAAPAFEPQMILLDVMMPELDGPGTLLRLRQMPALAEVPVIFVTAKTRPAELDRFRELGAFEVLAKPFKPMTISDDLRACWRRFNETRQAPAGPDRSGTERSA